MAKSGEENVKLVRMVYFERRTEISLKSTSMKASRSNAKHLRFLQRFTNIKAYKPQNVERKAERYAFVILIVKEHQNEFYEKSLQIDY